MTVSMIKAKAEAQKLIKQYRELQAEAKIAKTPDEAARKTVEAERLVIQITALKKPIAKAREQVTQISTAPVEKNRLDVIETSLVDRVLVLEEAQKKTRIQIEQLNRAKSEIGHLKQQAKKSIVNATQDISPNNEKLQLELARLIKKKEAEQLSLKQELDLIRKQTKKEAEILKRQRDAARALVQQHEQEKEQSFDLQSNSSSKKDILIGIGIGIVFSLILCKCG